jgi:hypothetical protein
MESSEYRKHSFLNEYSIRTYMLEMDTIFRDTVFIINALVDPLSSYSVMVDFDCRPSVWTESEWQLSYRHANIYHRNHHVVDGQYQQCIDGLYNYLRQHDTNINEALQFGKRILNKLIIEYVGL